MTRFTAEPPWGTELETAGDPHNVGLIVRGIELFKTSLKQKGMWESGFDLSGFADSCTMGTCLNTY